MDMMIAPFTLRTHSAMGSRHPGQKTRTGQPVAAARAELDRHRAVSRVRRAKPASTKPMNAMNRPMPTLIATLS